MSVIAGEPDQPSQHRRVGRAAADRVLVGRLSAGDQAALAEIYSLYGGLVFSVARRVLREAALAEDVTQEVFVFVWVHPDRFDPTRGSLKTWLGLLAHRRAIDRVRAERRRATGEGRVEPPAAIVSEADDYLTATWLSGRVRDALDKLPDDQRQAVVLAYFGGRSYREVADELALPEGTVKSRIRLALRKLDSLLRTEFTDHDEPAWT